MAGLIDLLAGGAPTAADETTGAIAGGLASDPSRLAYSSGPVGQALGQISGGFYQAQARAAAQRIADAHTAALPSLLKAYSSDDPWGTIAADTTAPPYAKWMIGQQTPQQVAQAKLGLANAGLVRAETPGVEAKSRITQAAAGEYLGAGAGGGAAPAGAPAGAGGGAGAPSAGVGAGAPPAAAPEQLTPDAQSVLAMPPGPDKAAALKRLPLPMQRLILSRIKRPGAPGAGAPSATTTAPAGAPAAPPPAMSATPAMSI